MPCHVMSSVHVARTIGSPRHACTRRRRTREGPELASVQTPRRAVAPQGVGGRANKRPAVVPSSRRGRVPLWLMAISVRTSIEAM